MWGVVVLVSRKATGRGTIVPVKPLCKFEARTMGNESKAWVPKPQKGCISIVGK